MIGSRSRESIGISVFGEPDSIQNPNLGFGKHPSVLVIGSGDGALQDALRCLIDPDMALHPLAIWDVLMMPVVGKKLSQSDLLQVKSALAKVIAADSYTTTGAIWTSDTAIFDLLDAEFRAIAAELLENLGLDFELKLMAMVRHDVEKVMIVNRYGYFSKAYALNRFLIYLFAAVLPTSKLEICSGKVSWLAKVARNPRGATVNFQSSHGKKQQCSFDLVILRGGLDKSTSPAQQIGLSGKDAGRAGLGRIPMPIKPIV